MEGVVCATMAKPCAREARNGTSERQSRDLNCLLGVIAIIVFVIDQQDVLLQFHFNYLAHRID